jgi:hypothetical protein
VPALTFITLFWATVLLIALTALMFLLACLLRLAFRMRLERHDATVAAAKQLLLEAALQAEEAKDAEVLAQKRELRRQKTARSTRKLLAQQAQEESDAAEAAAEEAEVMRQRLKRQATKSAAHFHTPPLEDFKRRLLHSTLLLCSIFFLKLNTLQWKMFSCVRAPTPETVYADEPVYAEFLAEDYQTPCYASAHLGTTIAILVLFIVYSFGCVGRRSAAQRRSARWDAMRRRSCNRNAHTHKSGWRMWLTHT